MGPFCLGETIYSRRPVRLYHNNQPCFISASFVRTEFCKSTPVDFLRVYLRFQLSSAFQILKLVTFRSQTPFSFKAFRSCNHRSLSFLFQPSLSVVFSWPPSWFLQWPRKLPASEQRRALTWQAAFAILLGWLTEQDVPSVLLQSKIAQTRPKDKPWQLTMCII